jgi:hypothetical protein
MSDYTTVKEAAERLRRVEVNAFNGDVCWISKVYDPVWGNPPGIDWNHDLRVVGIAYCREHPSDDDEPVSDEWLTRVGFEYCDELEAIYAYCPELGGRQMPLIVDGDTWKFGEFEIRQPKNCGEVRRLCAALGITLDS